MMALRYAFRVLTKSPSFSVPAIFALALGIGATTAMFAVLYAFLLRPLPFADPNQLVMIQSRNARSGNDVGVNYLDFTDWQKQNASFSGLAFFNLRWNGNLESPDGTTETLKTTFTTANLFSLLGVQPVAGRNLTEADDQPNAARVALISHRLWQRTFGGSPDVIGREIHLDGGSRTVVGVMPPGFRFPSQSDIWVPMGSVFAKATNRSWRADQAIARLKSDVTLDRAQAEMTLIAGRLARQYPDSNKEIEATVVPLREHWTGRVRFSLLLLWTGCGGVLLIACANVSQLLLARATTRQRELAVRAALGASRWDLARQVLTESVLLGFIGSAAGTLLAYWLVDLVAASIPVELPFWIHIDVNPGILLFAITISFITAVLAGALPAWQAAHAGISPALKTAASGNTAGGGRGARFREVLTIGQVAASIVLLVGASLLLRSLFKLEEVNPGFDGRNVLMMEVNPTYVDTESPQVRIDRFSRILERLAKMPGVESVAANNSPPFVPQRPWNRAEITAEHQSMEEQDRNPTANFQTVSARYFQVVRIPLLRGRLFNEHDTIDAPRVCIVSQQLASRLWPDGEAIGNRVKLGKPQGSPDAEWMTVIGVVGDVRHQALENEPGPDLYNSNLQLVWKQMHFLASARQGFSPQNLAPAIRREIAAVAPEVGVFNFVSLGDEVANSLWQQRLRGWLLGFFSVVALSLSAAGLYGAVAYGVGQRTREIGIRMALGATRGSVVRLVLEQGMQAVAIGLGLGLIGAFLVSRSLEASLFGINSHDFASYGVACLMLAIIAIIASVIPARRASLVNPVEALRAE